jgi:hypothetical protein
MRVSMLEGIGSVSSLMFVRSADGPASLAGLVFSFTFAL